MAVFTPRRVALGSFPPPPGYVRAGGRAYADVRTKISRIDRLPDLFTQGVRELSIKIQGMLYVSPLPSNLSLAITMGSNNFHATLSWHFYLLLYNIAPRHNVKLTMFNIYITQILQVDVNLSITILSPILSTRSVLTVKKTVLQCLNWTIWNSNLINK